MQKRTSYVVAAVLTMLSVGADAGIADIASGDAVTGLKDALVQGSQKAVTQLGKDGGFLNDARVRIPLPDSLQKAEKGLKLLGMSKQVEELETGMNRAAEMAVHEAGPVLSNSIKQMSVADAKGILTGGDTAATDYFRRTTSETLSGKFQPIVKKMTARIKLADKYNNVAGRGAQLGLVKKEDANLDGYVTRKALDGLFLMIGEEEKNIRHDPLGAAKGIASKVFDALKR